MVDVKIIADSISPSGKRITTFQLKYWRAIHAEVMTHRMFSRSASSSRAIPVEKMLEQVRTDPAGPIFWGANKPGMQAGSELTGTDLDTAKNVWKYASLLAAERAESMARIGVHKQIANRLLEPFQYIHVVLTATEFENFFNLRIHPAAQPEIQELAREMKKAQDESIPKQLFRGDWHIPYIQESEENLPLEIKLKISTARCARVSYKNHDNSSPDVNKDVELHDRLVGSVPLHASPAEHQAQCRGDTQYYKNFVGWTQYRYIVESNINQLGAK